MLRVSVCRSLPTRHPHLPGEAVSIHARSPPLLHAIHVTFVSHAFSDHLMLPPPIDAHHAALRSRSQEHQTVYPSDYLATIF